MKPFSYSIISLLLCIISCSPISKSAITYTSFQNGIYTSGSLYVTIKDNLAYTEAYGEGSDRGRKYYYKQQNFFDTLQKNNDTLYSGKIFKLLLTRGKLFLDIYSGYKDGKPRELRIINSKDEKRLYKYRTRLK